MAKTYASRKAKGNRLEQKIAALYRRFGLFPNARRMPTSGAMKNFRSDILKGEADEFVDECKNQERISLWKWWNQAWDQAKMQGSLKKPVLHVGGNYRPMLTVMFTEDYMQLRKTIKDYENEQP